MTNNGFTVYGNDSLRLLRQDTPGLSDAAQAARQKVRLGTRKKERRMDMPGLLEIYIVAAKMRRTAALKTVRPKGGAARHDDG
jgi:hypothetical protein